MVARLSENRNDNIDHKVLEELQQSFGTNILNRSVSPHEYNKLGVVIEMDRALKLGLHKLGLSSFPECITKLKSLTTLDLGYNYFTSLPEHIGQLTELQSLDLQNNKLTILPDSICRTKSLTHSISAIISSLRSPDLSGNSQHSHTLCTPAIIETHFAPESIGQLTSLTFLYLDHNQLTSLPESIKLLTSLMKLELSSNRTHITSRTHCCLKSLNYLHIGKINLYQFPILSVSSSRSNR